ncbi:hypothetical protein HMN09_00915500 [Mycena chlorophos]|uniref:Uncharacterized protein n=1 Tax=Mycena chlorophos TaxID=658473 RepID=A0A8H6SK40_MYCCL|nr:hypothetical protein HMN09_00915500 [Mycena chlorophos]
MSSPYTQTPLETTAFTVAAYIRVAALSVAAFEYLQVLPFVYRLLREPWTTGRISSTFVLFFLLQATSIAVLTITNVGFFATNFSYAECLRFYILPGIFKLFQAGVVQIILGLRAWSISRKSRGIAFFIVAIYIVCGTFAWLTTLYNRRIAWKPDLRNCSSIGPRGVLGGWDYYIVAFSYDFAVTCISGWYLIRMSPSPRSALAAQGMSRLPRMILIDGLWYFVVLSAANLASVAFYRIIDIRFSGHSPDVAGDLQTAAATLGYAVRWIMTQKMMVHLHEAAIARREDSIAEALSIGAAKGNNTQTRPSSSMHGASAFRARFTKTTTRHLSLTVPDFDDDAESFDERLEGRTPSGLGAAPGLEDAKEERCPSDAEGADGRMDEEEERMDEGVSVRVERTYQIPSAAGRRKAAEAMSMSGVGAGAASQVRYSRDVGTGSGESGRGT